jgi:hypothetical protein
LIGEERPVQRRQLGREHGSGLAALGAGELLLEPELVRPRRPGVDEEVGSPSGRRVGSTGTL